MWALKNGDLDEVKDYVAKVSGDEKSRREHGGGLEMWLKKLMGARLRGWGWAGGGETSWVEAAPGREGRLGRS